jgi:hypothetical protein
MNDLYLIGNGFDLAHGLKTSYNDFLLWYLNDSLQNCTTKGLFNDNLITIKREGYTYSNLLNYESLKELLGEMKRMNFSIMFHYDFFKNLVENYSGNKWVDIEYEYYSTLVKLFKEIELNPLFKEAILNEVLHLNFCFDSIKKKLVEYLKLVDNQDIKENDRIKNILYEGTGAECDSKGEKLFLYFNYTSTLNLYTEHYFAYEYNSIYIHGKLGELLDYNIFGYGDEMDPYYEKIENLNVNEFLKNIKSFSYFKTSNYQKLIRFIESRDFTVKVLGHSCGLSDRILLNTLFEHLNCKAIKIYYYQKSETENDYFEKTQEISRHFKASGKGNMRTKIVSFDESIPLIPFSEI